MAGRKSDFTLTKLDDLFTTQAQREEEKLSKIRDIPLGLIDDFPDHPFKVRDDEDMLQLIESIRDRGVITPATVRQVNTPPANRQAHFPPLFLPGNAVRTTPQENSALQLVGEGITK